MRLEKNVKVEFINNSVRSRSDIDEDCSEKMTFDSVQNSNRNCGSLIFKGVGLLQDDEVVWNSTKRWQTMGIAHSEFKVIYKATEIAF